MRLLESLELGAGISYQDHRRPESINSKNYGKIQNTRHKSLPIYTLAKYNIPLEGNVKPYLKADFGYSFNFDEKDLKGDRERIKTSIGNTSSKFDYDYSRTTLSVGYKFNF